MDSQGSSVFVYLFLALLVLSVVLIIWMFVSLVRSELEDERRKLIVGKACTWTLIATVGANLIEVIEVAAAQPERGPKVFLRTAFGGTRILDMLVGEQLPRIC